MPAEAARRSVRVSLNDTHCEATSNARRSQHSTTCSVRRIVMASKKTAPATGT
jgi:hypothetical protein